MQFMRRSLMGLFLLALTVGLLALAGGSLRSTLQERWSREATKRPARERVFAVNVITAEKATVTPVISTFGEIRSRRILDVRVPVGGTIIGLSKNFIDGGRIAKGDLLLQLDPANAQTALDVSLTEMTEKKAELIEAGTAQVLAVDEVAAAKAQVELRRAAQARQQNLLARGVGTAAALETAQLALASANQAVLGKRQALAQAQARISRATTALARQEIHLTETRRKLEDTKVFADFDGVLSSVTVVSGGLVSPNEKLARLIDPNALEVAFRISNRQFVRLVAANNGRASGEVTVFLEILGAEVEAKGQIERVSAEVAEGQTGRQIFARLPALSSDNFRPGDFVSVAVNEPQISGIAVLPATAIDASGIVLILGENDRLEELQTTIVRRQDDNVILRGTGLFGREVVEARSPLLGAGIKVKPRRSNGKSTLQEPEMIELSEERRAKLIAAIKENKRMPKDVREQLLARLKKDKVPADMVNRIEARMGG